ncbi:MAG: hypothetical protein M0R21_11165 [Lentimicrobiaceae bacterium]|jgi:hypothetical protein|nr:hypothetical protein [Lentimicrobiaceae bacterium]
MKKTVHLFLVLLSVILFISSCGIPFSKTLQRQFVAGNDKIKVYPVHILAGGKSSYDTVYSRKIQEFLIKSNRETILCFENPPVNRHWFMNEAKMFKKSFNVFAEFIQASPSDENYHLLVEFLMSNSEKHVLAVHYYLVEKKSGKAVMAYIINSHNPVFKKIKPMNKQDAFRIFCEVFTQKLSIAEKN